MHQRFHILMSGFLVLFLNGTSGADDWRTWRGPHQDGRTDGDEYFSNDASKLRIVWEKQIGTSYSGLSVSKGLLLVPFADGESDWLGALDGATGTFQWKYRVGDMYPAHDGGHDGPLSTPVADDERVYLLGPHGKLVAIDHSTGERIWAIDLPKEYSADVPFWGFCTTPALSDEAIFVQVSGASRHGVIAFDKKDGSIRWEHELGGTDYRSPILTKFDGRTQLICCSRDETCGFDPQTGKRLWRVKLQSMQGITPVRVADDKLLLEGRDGTELRQWQGDKSTTAWTTHELRGTYGTPIVHQGYLYGFTRHALTCIDARTGKRIWRSRAPGGGKGLILVDDHLVIFSVTGHLIVVKASNEGYVERARLKLSTADGYAAPAFADGRIFVRNLAGQVFAIEATSTASNDPPQTEPQHEFARFIQSLDNQADKDDAIRSFLERHEAFPIVEDDRWIHFIYYGDADDVAIHGSMTANGEEDALRRVPGTDLFYRSYAIEPGSRWEYRLVVDFEKSMLDPRNPRVSPMDATRSEVLTSTWSEPNWATVQAGESRGRLETISHGGHQTIVYLPHDYDSTKKDYPLLVVTDGEDWLSQCMVQDVLDHRFTNEIEPSIVLFPTERGMGGSNTAEYARMVARELIPLVETKYRVRQGRKDRTVLGKRGGAVAAVFIALAYPDDFGRCVAISYGRADTVRSQKIRTMAEQRDGVKPKFRVSWNRYEKWRPQSFHCRQQSVDVSNLLRELGYEVSGGEKKESSNWRSWRVHFGEALE